MKKSNYIGILILFLITTSVSTGILIANEQNRVLAIWISPIFTLIGIIFAYKYKNTIKLHIPSKTRRIASMYAIEDKSMYQIAKELDINDNKVRREIIKALKLSLTN